eukprot:TRINITY_DN562_c0_g1_i1.p1 TRINITY_DN562_c0_g1~~TRINITY_DN562_c0_g1_i1.p1  ORF type:complete len:236 (-),score=41.65 TRINITY_DN562_c0_g1_i1:140-847(-)
MEESVSLERAVDWVPDQDVTNCQGCTAKFSFTRRKHHCRGCGGIYCASCSSNKAMVNEKLQRVCEGCYKYFICETKATIHMPLLLDGLMFRKHGRTGFPHDRFVFLSDDKEKICYKAKSLLRGRTEEFPLRQCERVIIGQKTPVLERSGTPENAHLYVSLMFAFDSLDLEAPSRSLRDRWFEALSWAVERLKVVPPNEQREHIQKKLSDVAIAVRQQERREQSQRRMNELREKYN